MPRGTPKDPNHPRNSKKKSDTAATGAPKRRGRPPGSKNTAKSQETAVAVAPVKMSSQRLDKSAGHDWSQTYRNPQAHLNIVRDNIVTLSHCTGPEAAHAVSLQIEQLLSLTEEIIGHDDSVDPAQQPPATNQALTVTSSLPTPPNFSPPPFPPHLPG